MAVPGSPTLLATSTSPVVILLTWEDVSEFVTAWQLQVSTDGTNFTDLAYPLSPVARKYTHGGLTSGTRYWYRIRGVNLEGDGTWSTRVNTQALSAMLNAPSRPRLSVLSQHEETTLYVSWNPGPRYSNTPPVTGWELQTSADGESGWAGIGGTNGVYPVATTLYQHENLTLGDKHYYRVRAANSEGNGEWSIIRNGVVGNTQVARVAFDGKDPPDLSSFRV